MANDRRNFLKKLGMGTAAGGAAAALTIKSAESAIEKEPSTKTVVVVEELTFDRIYQKVLEGEEITDMEARIYAGELLNQMHANVKTPYQPGDRIPGLKLWADLGSSDNLIKVHKYAKHGLMWYIALRNG